MITEFITINLICIVFIAGYDIFLKNSGQFLFNRVYLLLVPILAFVFTALPQVAWFPASFDNIQSITLPTIFLNEPVVSSDAVSYWNIGIGAYCLIGIIILSKSFLALIDNYFTSNQKIGKIDGFEVFYSENESFSLINRLFLSKNDQNEQLIIQHELAHLNQHHWIDLLFLQLTISVFWINPMMWRWSVLIRQNHEYLADAAVSKTYEFGKTNYIHLLLDKAFDTKQFSMGNYFSMHSLISKRINMLNKNKKEQPWKLAVIAALMGVSGIIIASCAKSNADEPVKVKKVMVKKIIDENGEEKIIKEESEEEVPASSITDGEVNIEKEVFLPSFKGGKSEMINYLIAELKYPESCKASDIEGKVLVAFEISEEGAVENARIVESVHKDLDKEALRVVNAMPNWEPGTENGKNVRMEMKLPVMFKMKQDKQVDK